MSKFLFFTFLASTTASAWYNLSDPLDPRTAESTVRSRKFGRLTVSRNDVLTSISLLDCEIIWNVQILATLAPVASILARLSADSSRSCQKLAPEDPQMMWSRLAAVCFRLLDAPEWRNFWMTWWWRRHDTGSFLNCQRDWSACAPRSCSCRSWAHDLFGVGLAMQTDSPSTLVSVCTSVMSKATKRGWGRRLSRRRARRWGQDRSETVTWREMRHTNSLYLNQCDVPTFEKCSAACVLQFSVCTRASARVQEGVVFALCSVWKKSLQENILNNLTLKNHSRWSHSSFD